MSEVPLGIGLLKGRSPPRVGGTGGAIGGDTTLGRAMFLLVPCWESDCETQQARVCDRQTDGNRDNDRQRQGKSARKRGGVGVGVRERQIGTLARCACC